MLPSPHQSVSAVRSGRSAGKHEGAAGAFIGGFAAVKIVSLLLLFFGLALTPLGWVLILGIGAVLGGAGIFKRMAQ